MVHRIGVSRPNWDRLERTFSLPPDTARHNCRPCINNRYLHLVWPDERKSLSSAESHPREKKPFIVLRTVEPTFADHWLGIYGRNRLPAFVTAFFVMQLNSVLETQHDAQQSHEPGFT